MYGVQKYPIKIREPDLEREDLAGLLNKSAFLSKNINCRSKTVGVQH